MPIYTYNKNEDAFGGVAAFPTGQMREDLCKEGGKPSLVMVSCGSITETHTLINEGRFYFFLPLVVIYVLGQNLLSKHQKASNILFYNKACNHRKEFERSNKAVSISISQQRSQQRKMEVLHSLYLRLIVKSWVSLNILRVGRAQKW